MPPEPAAKEKESIGPIRRPNLLRLGRKEQGGERAERPSRTLLERAAVAGVQTLFKKEGIEFEDTEFPQLKLHKPDIQPFPVIIFLMALCKDGLIDFPTIIGDLVGTTGIGLIVTTLVRTFSYAFTFITWMTLFFWMWGKLNSLMKLGIKGMTRKFLKYVLKRFFVGVTIEAVLPLVPFTVIFVLLAHHRENKYVRLFLSAAEQFGKAMRSGKIR